MTDFAWPNDLVPYAVEFYLQPHTGGSESPFSRASKIYGLSAPRWICSLSFRGGYWGTDGAEAYGPRLDAVIAKLKGRQNRATLHDFRRSTMRLTPGGSLGNLAAAAGSSVMTITGLAADETVYAGDYIGGDGRPHIITDSIVADGSGNATVPFEPPLVANVAADAGVFGNPTGAFRLVDDDAGANGVEVGSAQVVTLQFVEDLAGPSSSALLAGETLGGLAIDMTTYNVDGEVTVINPVTPTQNYQGSMRAFRPALAWTSKSVTNSVGATVSTVTGEIPYDYSGTGVQAMLVEAADALTIPQTLFPTVKTLYFEYERERIAGTEERAILLDGGADYFEHRLADTNTSDPFFSAVAADGTLTKQGLGDSLESVTDDGVICLTVSLTPNKVAFSMNGGPPVAIREVDNIALTQLAFALQSNLANTHKLRFRRLVAVPREVPLNELAAWRYSPLAHSEHIVAGGVVRVMPDDTSTQREPSKPVIISESGDVCRYAIVHMDKNGPGYTLHDEMPARLRMQVREFNRSTLTDTAITEESAVIYEHTDWATGDGHNQSPVLLYSTARSQWELYWSRMNDSVASGVDGVRDVYRKVSASFAGLTAATATMVLPYTARSPLDGVGTHTYIVLDPLGSHAELSDGTIVIPCYTSTDARCMIINPAGVCSLGNGWASAGADGVPNEASVALRPDGVPVFFARMGSTSDRRGVYESTDSGLNGAYLGLVSGYTGVGAAAGVVQTDPDGTGWGRIAIARPAWNGASPTGIQVGFVEDSSRALQDNTEILTGWRYTRYVSVGSCFDGEFLIIAFEYGHHPSFNQWQHVGVMVVRTPT